ncbi:LysR family transcriptional regulator [Erwinia sp. OLTSP20]|uniref:LysR substrate-binding domain-containing protein n=1 Tax=unclassified Erwinia TaxID=2622719 RepID=UPI000C195BF2|nr:MULTISPECIES: LysR substrate-binding domain-containing protein [unclassified Erwinia]PIJ49519.1 LysR family transcriptional regulator [Erwinia sp. OAMSP11]PIJ71185.1 LysR family transcriptional regulator [Erwinia sp. OLSSP12]PIJ79834.1 LysR family transcriptional regulator [Erwinia sp. OLCASP19]PIJ81597.1 LysR family transcriptional regulator [Erwinia sp. OLMTSP26]PIJ84012.1 LysR family transcriptional regulator [Erwinia sp. OLMDSP33]
MDKNNLFTQRIRLRHLHTFVAVAQQGTLGRAAETLNLSQPALSKTLNELEELTGARLFERGRLGARLTTLGEQFLTHAVKVLDALHHAGQSFNSDNDAPTLLRLGVLTTVALGMLPSILHLFHQQQPNTLVQVATLHNNVLLAGLRGNEFDIGIGRMATPEMMAGLNYELLFLESLRLVVRPDHPLLSDNVTLSRAMNWPVVISPEGTAPRRIADNMLKEQGCQLPATVVETSATSLARQLALRYDYVWFVPSGAIKEDLAHSALAALPIASHGPGEPVGIITRSADTLSVGAEILLSAIRKLQAG